MQHLLYNYCIFKRGNTDGKSTMESDLSFLTFILQFHSCIWSQILFWRLAGSFRVDDDDVKGYKNDRRRRLILWVEIIPAHQTIPLDSAPSLYPLCDITVIVLFVEFWHSSIEASIPWTGTISSVASVLYFLPTHSTQTANFSFTILIVA